MITVLTSSNCNPSTSVTFANLLVDEFESIELEFNGSEQVYAFSSVVMNALDIVYECENFSTNDAGPHSFGQGIYYSSSSDFSNSELVDYASTNISGITAGSTVIVLDEGDSSHASCVPCLKTRSISTIASVSNSQYSNRSFLSCSSSPS